MAEAGAEVPRALTVGADDRGQPAVAQCEQMARDRLGPGAAG